MKAWWDRWGTPVTSVVCVCCLAFAGWNGWNWWQRNQAAKASQIYAALQNAVATHDLKNVQSLSAGLISEYSSTLYAPLAALLLHSPRRMRAIWSMPKPSSIG